MCGIVGLLVKNPVLRPQLGALMVPMLVGMTERYLLDTYGRGPAVDVTVAAATLAEIWQRTLFSSGIEKPPVSEHDSGRVAPHDA